ncbi:MAG: hypothetical protein KY462_17010 [Actinobacteria bacterium]|nr:hypothetical protein [Actinomycetota bacterium]
MVTRLIPFLLVFAGLVSIVVAMWAQYGWTWGLFVAGIIATAVGILAIEV